MIDFDLWEASVYSTLDSAKVNYMWRWTEHPDNDQTTFNDPDILIKKVETTLKPYELKEMVFQLELGPKTGKRHYQGFFRIAKKQRTKRIAKELNNVLFGIEIAGAMDTNSVKKYVTKMKSRIDGPFYYPKLYEGEDTLIIETNPYQWQIDMLEFIKQPPIPRKITWIVDFKGNSGKSTFIKYLAHDKTALVLGFEPPRDLCTI